MIKIKNGADVRGLKDEIWDIVYETNKLYEQYGVDCVITSGLDGKHSKTSLHYLGYAVDIRIRNLKREGQAEYIVDKHKDLHDKLYDIILEKTHIHIEYDPRYYMWSKA